MSNSEKPVVGLPNTPFPWLLLLFPWIEVSVRIKPQSAGWERLVQTLVLPRLKASCLTQHHHHNWLTGNLILEFSLF